MKTIRMIIAGMSIMLGVVGLTACGSTEEAAPVCVGLVIGARSNSAPVSGAQTAGSLPDPLPVGSVVAVTGVSGSPDGDAVYSARVEKGESSYDTADNQQNIRGGAISSIERIQASSPQADVLGAIEATAEKLRPSGMSCTIYVYDSGLQTTGLIRFQQGLLALSPDDIVDRVPESRVLAGITVVFESLGVVAPPQPALDSASREKLDAIWNGIIESRGGRTAASTQITGATREPSSSLPEVDVVEIPHVTIDVGGISPSCTLESTTWSLPDWMLFDEDSPILKDEAADSLDIAADVLTGFCAQYPAASVLVVGHTASVSVEPTGMELSQQRAQAVVDHLVSHGLDSSRIVAEGVGDTQPSCEDFDPVSGRQIPDCAEQERRVELTVLGLVLCQ